MQTIASSSPVGAATYCMKLGLLHHKMILPCTYQCITERMFDMIIIFSTASR
jgi:hypothetical protein